MATLLFSLVTSQKSSVESQSQKLKLETVSGCEVRGSARSCHWSFPGCNNVTTWVHENPLRRNCVKTAKIQPEIIEFPAKHCPLSLSKNVIMQLNQTTKISVL